MYSLMEIKLCHSGVDLEDVENFDLIYGKTIATWKHAWEPSMGRGQTIYYSKEDVDLDYSDETPDDFTLLHKESHCIIRFNSQCLKCPWFVNICHIIS